MSINIFGQMQLANSNTKLVESATSNRPTIYRGKIRSQQSKTITVVDNPNWSLVHVFIKFGNEAYWTVPITLSRNISGLYTATSRDPDWIRNIETGLNIKYYAEVKLLEPSDHSVTIKPFICAKITFNKGKISKERMDGAYIEEVQII